MEPVSFVVDGEPVPASRPRVTPRGTYYPKRHRERHEFLKQALAETPPYPTANPVEVRILSVMPRYKTSDHPVHRSDVDNLAKLPMDVMTQVERYWKDDDLIVSLISLKRFAREGEEPHTKIVIVPFEGSPEDWADHRFNAP